MKRQSLFLLLAGVLLLAACAPRPATPARQPLVVATQPVSYPAPGNEGQQVSAPGGGAVGAPMMESRLQIQASIMDILAPDHPDARHQVQLQILSLTTSEGMPPAGVVTGATLLAYTKEDLSAFKAGDTIQATLRVTGDENGSAYWLLNVQPIAYP